MSNIKLLMLIQVEEQLTHFTLGSDISMVEEQILSQNILMLLTTTKELHLKMLPTETAEFQEV